MRTRPPLNLGDRIPTEDCLQDFIGQPMLISFASPEWDPYRQETLALYQDLLLEVFGPDVRLLHLAKQGHWCDLDLGDAGHWQLPILDNQAHLSEAFGIQDQEALFVVDSEGFIRWRYVNDRGGLPTAPYLAQALAELQLQSQAGHLDFNRRQFLLTGLALAGLATMGFGGEVWAKVPSHVMPMQLRVNGTLQPLQLDPRVTLLDALRDHLHLTGSKKGCDHGQCGACTVLIDGRRINSCLTLAVMQQGRSITTIEGLAEGEQLHPLQKAFIARDGLQCGYCTPGQIMAAQGLLNEGCGPLDDDVREAMSGNICRCGCYTNIVAAIQDVRRGGSQHASL